jgi:hypothetical protein
MDGAVSYASYIAKLDRTFGDEEVGRGLKMKWLDLGVSQPDPFDGVARFPNGIVRFVARNIFCESSAPVVWDLPPT